VKPSVYLNKPIVTGCLKNKKQAASTQKNTAHAKEK
jgi:hypothetical protein